MSNEDLTISTKNGIFNYRSTYFIFNQDSILLTSNKYEDYYFMPGGRVKFGETAQNALLREVEEEINIKLDTNQFRFAGIIENYFTLNGNKSHELNMCFHVTIEDPNGIPDTDDNGNIFSWVKLSKMNDIQVYPKILKEKAHLFKAGIHNLVNIDN